MIFFSLSIEDLLTQLNSSINGLSSEEATKRLAQFGPNRLVDKPQSKIKLFFLQFRHFLIYLLIAASILSLFLKEFTDFLFINLIILLNAVVGYIQELKASNAIDALKKMSESRHHVLRDGKLILVPSGELVPGDVIHLYDGEVITSDIRLLSSSGLCVDESAMTGESLPVVKNHLSKVSEKAMIFELTNSLISGTHITSGSGIGLIVNTGKERFISKIADRAQEKSPKTPIDKALDFFLKRYVLFLMSLLILIGTIGFFQGRDPLNLTYVLVASLVSAVPAGLPVVITIVMVVGAIMLSRKKTLIRHLPAVETLGCTNIIASDKTGTITEGQIKVESLFSLDESMLKTIATVCNDSKQGHGDPIDRALIEHFGVPEASFKRNWTLAFDSKLMLMATEIEINGRPCLLVKGALEKLIEKLDSSQNLDLLNQHYESFLNKGLRTLAFAYSFNADRDLQLWKLKIAGIVGFIDPPKPGVKEAIFIAKTAGLKVIMITGDHPLTALSIAKKVGLCDNSQQVMTGQEIEAASEKTFKELLKSVSVFARILPEHKYKIVKSLQNNGSIVAVTGDGVNDVPALKAADIGIAMGNGTDAAKNVSKMVITDNNLSVITDAIHQARITADNIRKVMYYLLSTSLQEIFLIAFSIFMNLPVPLSAIQILWINLVTDGVQDKLFPFAKEENCVMQRQPKSPRQQFFDRSMIFNILYFGLSVGGIIASIYYVFYDRLDPKILNGLIFTCVAIAQWGNGIQAQKEFEPFFKDIKKSFTINPWIFGGILLGIILQLIALYPMGKIFEVSPIPLNLWKVPLITFFGAFFLVEIRKWCWFIYTKKI